MSRVLPRKAPLACWPFAPEKRNLMKKKKSGKSGTGTQRGWENPGVRTKAGGKWVVNPRWPQAKMGQAKQKVSPTGCPETKGPQQ